MRCRSAMAVPDGCEQDDWFGRASSAFGCANYREAAACFGAHGRTSRAAFNKAMCHLNDENNYVDAVRSRLARWRAAF